MPVTVFFYNDTRRALAAGEIDIDALKVMLLNGHTFNPAHDDIASISGDEVSGAGWSAGGELVANTVLERVNDDEARITGDNVVVTATAGDIGPADAFVLYQDLSGLQVPLLYVDFGDPRTAEDGSPFRVLWNAAGIVTFQAAAVPSV